MCPDGGTLFAANCRSATTCISTAFHLPTPPNIPAPLTVTCLNRISIILPRLPHGQRAEHMPESGRSARARRPFRLSVSVKNYSKAPALRLCRSIYRKSCPPPRPSMIRKWRGQRETGGDQSLWHHPGTDPGRPYPPAGQTVGGD